MRVSSEPGDAPQFGETFVNNNFCLFINKILCGIFSLISFEFSSSLAESNVKKASTASATAASAKLTNNSIKGNFWNQFWEVGDILRKLWVIRRKAEGLSAVLHSFSAVSSTDYSVNFEITLERTI